MKFLSTMLILACCAAPGIAGARGGGFVGGGGTGTHFAFHGSVGVHGNNHVVVHQSRRGFPFAVARRSHNGHKGAGTTAFPFGAWGWDYAGDLSYPQEAGVISGPADYPPAAPMVAAEMPLCREMVAGVTIVRGKSCRS